MEILCLIMVKNSCLGLEVRSRALRHDPQGRRVGTIRNKSAARFVQDCFGLLVNADCNGAANIMRKVATQLGLNLAEVGRGTLTVPQRYDMFTRLDKAYRKRCEGRLSADVATSA
jgi:hypothetical protein